jgi:hypothetical protein
MAWTVVTSEEFDRWWGELDGRTQDSLATIITMLKHDGPTVPRPYADKLKGSRYDLRELRDTVYDERNQEHHPVRLRSTSAGVFLPWRRQGERPSLVPA